MDLQRVAGLGTFDVERAGLRIDLGEVELWRDRCVGDGERVGGGGPRAGDTGVPGLDAQGRRMGIAVSEINLVAWIVPHFGRHGRPGERKPGDRQQQRGRQQPQRLSRCSISPRHIRYLPRIFWLHFICTLTRSLASCRAISCLVPSSGTSSTFSATPRGRHRSRERRRRNICCQGARRTAGNPPAAPWSCSCARRSATPPWYAGTRRIRAHGSARLHRCAPPRRPPRRRAVPPPPSPSPACAPSPPLRRLPPSLPPPP